MKLQLALEWFGDTLGPLDSTEEEAGEVLFETFAPSSVDRSDDVQGRLAIIVLMVIRDCGRPRSGTTRRATRAST